MFRVQAVKRDRRVMLGAYAAKQCPLRTFREHDPFEVSQPAAPDQDLLELFEAGHSFEDEMVESLREVYPSMVQIPSRDEASAADRQAATTNAIAHGVKLIAGALLAPDNDGHRLSEIDVLLRVDEGDGAAPHYRPVDIKNHRCTKNASAQSDLVEQFDGHSAGEAWAPRYHEGDCMQLAHYYRHLQSLGLAQPGDEESGIWAGVIGSEGVLAWHDLTELAFATLTPQIVDIDGDESIRFHKRSHSTRRTALDRYDFEFQFRIDLVEKARGRASADSELPVLPVKVDECERCPWNEVCDADLRERDDVSLVRGVNYANWKLHRWMGNNTAEMLAELDIDTARAMVDHGAATMIDGPDKSGLCERTLAYGDGPLKPAQLLEQIECARSLRAGGPIRREGVEIDEIPRADIEIDLDMENTADRRVYLWGAIVTHNVDGWPVPSDEYVPFVSWDPLDIRGEASLVAQLWRWLERQRDLAVAEGLTFKVYGYSIGAAESSHLKRIVAGRGISTLPSNAAIERFVDKTSPIAERTFVDLLPFMQQRWCSNDGHSLKVMAPAYGFEWRDSDPGGLKSIDWYEDAIAGVDTAANIARLLMYNEDDCRATRALR